MCLSRNKNKKCWKHSSSSCGERKTWVNGWNFTAGFGIQCWDKNVCAKPTLKGGGTASAILLEAPSELAAFGLAIQLRRECLDLGDALGNVSMKLKISHWKDSHCCNGGNAAANLHTANSHKQQYDHDNPSVCDVDWRTIKTPLLFFNIVSGSLLHPHKRTERVLSHLTEGRVDAHCAALVCQD